MTHAWLQSASLALCLGATACHSNPTPDAPLTDLSLDFDAEATGSLPAGLHVAETNGVGKTATWAVDAGGASGSGKCVRITSNGNRGDTFNMLMSDAPFAEHLSIEVALRADAGDEDQGGGVVWRAQGPDDYYVTRWNPLEDNLRIYKVEHGVRTQFQSAKVVVTPGLWHRLVVRMDGPDASVHFDGDELLKVHDTTFTGPGHVGLWTKADAATSFDELHVRSLRLPE